MKFTLLSVVVFFGLPLLAQEGRDYSLMTHKVFIDTLRSGNQDTSGTNRYYFVLKLLALRNTAEDRAKKIDDRPFQSSDPVRFGELKIPVLSTWTPESETKEDLLFVEVAGDQLRRLVSKSMRHFNVIELEIAVAARIEMYEHNKRFVYFGKDTLVGSVEYYPIPASSYHTPARTNLKLSIQEKMGTNVEIKVKYENPVNAKLVVESEAAETPETDESTVEEPKAESSDSSADAN